MNQKVVLTGATGMIGGIVLQKCLASSEIAQVVSFSRRPSGIEHPKLLEVILSNFNDYSGQEAHFKEVDIAHFCIGVYTGSVSDDLFKEITVDYSIAFADALKAHSPGVTFCFLSGSGADPKEKSRMAFAKYKGMAENHLIAKEFGALYIFRPGYIYPVEKRNEPNFTYKISRALYPIFKAFGKKYSIPSTELGEAMFKAGLQGAQKTILENQDILEILE